MLQAIEPQSTDEEENHLDGDGDDDGENPLIMVMVMMHMLMLPPMLMVGILLHSRPWLYLGPDGPLHSPPSMFQVDGGRR